MAGRIPQQFIDELMARVDIVDVIDTHVQLRKAGREYTACCPFHDEKTPSFTVSPGKQFYHCFGCGAHGTAISFLMEYSHLDFITAVEELAQRVGLEVPREAGGGAPAQETKALYELLERAARDYRAQLRDHPKGQGAIDYLKRRGVSGETAAAFGLGYAPPGWDHLGQALGLKGEDGQRRLAAAGLVIQKEGGGYYDRFRDRVMFPIRDARGRVIGFGGRVLDQGEPKYLNSPETAVFHKGSELYGLYEARNAERHLERLLVVEGYMDVIALAQHGIRHVVATLGTATTPRHLERLFAIVPEVVFCFDGDRAGREAAWRALEQALPVVREGRNARFLFLPEGEDPDSLVRKEGEQQFLKRTENAVTFSQFFYDSLLARADTTSIDGRARLVELARPYLVKMPPGVFRHMMEQRLAELAQVERAALQGLLAGQGPVAPARMLPAGAKGRGGRPTPSLVRKAVTLLVQHPELAQAAGDPGRLVGVEIAGVGLLVEILVFLQAHPNVRTGALVEHWRDTEHGRTLAKLAVQEPLVRAEDVARELQDALRRLEAQHIAEQIKALHRKPRKDWSMEDKNHLKQLLEQKASVS